MTLTFAMPSKENSVDLKKLPVKKPIKKPKPKGRKSTLVHWGVVTLNPYTCNDPISLGH